MNDDSYEKRTEMERLMMEDMLAKQRAYERGGMRWDSPDVKLPNNTIAHIVNDPITVSPYNETRVSTGQAVKSITEEHQAHVATHKSIIDRYYAEKQVEVLTEILAEVRSINRKLRKRVKK